MIRILLLLAYPLLLIARLLQSIFGGDPLRLKEPAGSCWIERPRLGSSTAYFSEASSVEGLAHGGRAGLATGFFVRVSRLFAPKRLTPGERYVAGADREKGIPDEVYTLW